MFHHPPAMSGQQQSLTLILSQSPSLRASSKASNVCLLWHRTSGTHPRSCPELPSSLFTVLSSNSTVPSTSKLLAPHTCLCLVCFHSAPFQVALQHLVTDILLIWLKHLSANQKQLCLGGGRTESLGRGGCASPCCCWTLALLFANRTVIAHTKALDPSRPVTFVTDANYALDRGVSLLRFLAFPFFLNPYIKFPPLVACFTILSPPHLPKFTGDI